MRNKIYTFTTIEQAIESVKLEYALSLTYLHGKFEHNGHYFTVRMNKDHNMHGTNNDFTAHVLSIVNGPCDRYAFIDPLRRVIFQQNIAGWSWSEIVDLLREFFALVYEFDTIED